MLSSARSPGGASRPAGGTGRSALILIDAAERSVDIPVFSSPLAGLAAGRVNASTTTTCCDPHLLLLLAIGYLLSHPSGYLAGRWLKGIDLRDRGLAALAPPTCCATWQGPSPGGVPD